MEQDFHQSQRLSGAAMSAALERRDAPAAFRFLFWVAALLASNAGMIWAWRLDLWWAWSLLLVVAGVVVCAMFAALHETAHNTAFKSLAANKIAAFVAGLVHLYPSSIFRELHFTHHRYTHIEGKDPEITLGTTPAPAVTESFFLYLSWMTGLPLLMFKLLMLVVGALGMPNFLRARLFPFVAQDARLAIFVESWVVLAAQGALVYWAVMDAAVWGIFIGQVVGHAFLAGYLIMEHNGLPHEGNIFERTRSMPVNGLVKFIFWNMPYHAEHHAYPAVPFYALPRVHELLGNEIMHKTETQPSFHAELWRKFLGLK